MMENPYQVPVHPQPIIKRRPPTSVTYELEEKNVYTTSVSKAELGMAFFRAGFKDMSRAGQIVTGIWALLPLNGVTTREKEDRFELSFAYLRQAGHSTGRRVEADSDTMVAYLMRKMQLLTSAFTVEVSEGVMGTTSLVKLTFVKQSILALADDGNGAVFRRPNDWKAVREETAGYTAEIIRMNKNCPYEADLAVVSYLLTLDPKPRLDFVSIEGFMAYHRAAFSIQTERFATSRLGKLVLLYPAQVQQRYRFMVVHSDIGYSRVEVLRKVSEPSVD
jgi:hypothetical protein